MLSKLIGMVTGNPYVLLGVVLGAFVLGGATGGSAAWWIQGLRITAAEQEHTAYVQEQKRIFQEALDVSDQKREQASAAYERTSNDLQKAISDGDVYRRCVAAGKCGVRVLKPTACAPSIRLPTPAGTDETRSDAIPSSAGAAEEDPVVNDCAITTLMLNQLQADIEQQAGYSH